MAKESSNNSSESKPETVTINIEKFMSQGLDPDQIEEVVSNKLQELDHLVVSVEFILNVQSIADAVQPETDKLLNRL